MGQQFGGRAGDCPVTESVSDRLIRLPLYFELSAEEQTEVIQHVQAFRTTSKAHASDATYSAARS
jgi:dTDP-4-amino-4,6-dideoxygalactose transaminase